MGVTAMDYPDMQFASLAAAGDMDALVGALQKALTAGTGTDSASFTGGRALVMESLEGTLQDVLFTEDHIKLFKKLKTTPLYATVDEWNVRDDYGGEFGTAVAETVNPPLATGNYERKFGYCAYYRDRREISHVLTQLKTITPEAMAAEEQAATRRLLSHVERDLFIGDRTIFPERIQGLQSSIMEAAAAYDSQLIYDMHGTPITTQAPFHRLQSIVYKQGGRLTDFYYPAEVQADVDNALADQQRIVVPVQSADGKIIHGASQNALRTAHGDLAFESDIFVRAGWDMVALDEANVADEALAPATPTVNSVTGNAGTIATQANLPAGVYQVRVAAVNGYGESAATAADEVTLVATNTIRITVTRAAATTTGYRVYLSAVGGDAADCRFHEEVACTAAQQVIELDGTWVTGTACAYGLDLAPGHNAVDFRQLFPLSKMDYAMVSPVFPFVVQFYGLLRVMKPNWNAMITNILPEGVLNLGWNPLGA